MKLIFGVLGGFLAVVAFAIILETPRKYVLHAGITGAIGTVVYLLGMQAGMGVVSACFLSALAIALTSHIFARIFKAPVTIFLIAGILPTVPGNGMYRIAYYVIAKNTELTGYYLIETLEIAGVIALAIFIVDTIFRLDLRKRVQKEENQGQL